MERGPIFIGGLAHSGKTPMRLLLAGQPNLVLTRRTYMWTRYYKRFGELAQRANFDRCLTTMLAQKHIQALNPDAERIRREFWQGEPTYANLFALLHQHYAEQLGKARWGDQLGFVERYADPIFAAYPGAKMIHMIRDPRARYAESTTRSQHRPGKVGWALARWLCSVRLMQQNQRRYPAQYKVVRYETLLAQPEETLRDVCAFLDEDFALSLDSIDTILGAEVSHASGADRVGELPTAGANVHTPAATKMSQRELAFTQFHAKRDMIALGYPLAPTQLSPWDRLFFLCIDWPVNAASRAAWHVLGKSSSRA